MLCRRSSRMVGTGGLSAAAVILLAVSLSGPVYGNDHSGDVTDEYTDQIPVVHDVRIPAPSEVGPAIYLDIPGMPLSPPPNPEVGDSWIWWLWTHNPPPPHFEQFVCTVRGKSDRGYVVVEDSQWLVNIDQSDVDMILERWENSSIGPYPTMGIYDIDSTAFGAPPDMLDDDPRIYLMWFEFGIPADGFFFFFDEYPEGTYSEYHSNECEVLYLNPTSSGGPSGDYMLAVIAHEFQHMIHWYYDDNEYLWVNEGLSELAMWFYGNPDNISSFNTNPDNNLTVWEGTWADYIKTYLWTLYFFERYGGHPTIFAVTHEPANSIAGYEAVLDDFGYSENFDDVFADWTVANFLDDTTLEDGRYGYLGDDLPPFNVAGTYTSYPVSNVYRTVDHWAADYYRFKDFNFESLLLSFDGDDGNSFAAWGLALYGDGSTEVHRITLDGTQSGSVEIGGLSDPDDEVILVAASASNSGGSGYYFSAGDTQGIGEGEDTTGGPEQFILMNAAPNPFSSTVNLQLTYSDDFAFAEPEISLFDVSGRLVRTISAETPGENTTVVVWDGSTDCGRQAEPGIYFARADFGSRNCTVRILRLP